MGMWIEACDESAQIPTWTAGGHSGSPCSDLIFMAGVRCQSWMYCWKHLGLTSGAIGQTFPATTGARLQ